MTKLPLAIACCILIGLAACSDSGTSADNANDSANTTANNTGASSTGTTNSTGTAVTDNKTPLNAQDSAFVAKAAIGGLMEVQAGNLAQQNAASERVKAFGAMMVNDHNKANTELMSLVAGRGVTIPTALPPDLQQHMDEMRKMQGKAFDKHYMSMMVNDHQKTIADFEKQANGGNDGELKSWAAKQLPVLQMHRDSATAINRVIK